MSSLSGYQFLALSLKNFHIFCPVCPVSYFVCTVCMQVTLLYFSHHDLISVIKKVFCPFMEQCMVNTYYYSFKIFCHF